MIYKPDFDILSKTNAIHPTIHFTLEESENDTLPFLDTTVTFDRRQSSFDFSLHVKNVHSNSCLPFSSCVPISRKRALLTGENHRVSRNSSLRNRQQSKAYLRRRFLANGFPSRMIEDLFDCSPVPTVKTEGDQQLTFIKLPFYGERWKRQILSLARRCDLLKKVRIIFETEKPLSLRFRLRRELPHCPPTCWTCETAVYKENCYKKFTVYQIQCKRCPKMYIGQTGRTIKSRIREHCTSSSSAFFQHANQQHQQLPERILEWRILATERNAAKRRALESFHIAQKRQLLVNGCAGDTLLPFICSYTV